jgi:hypothetical protein
MLYKLISSGKSYDSIEPMPFGSVADDGMVEKDLENLIAENLLDVLFESNQLIPIFQERQLQPEADVYAINKSGDLVIFEMKRARADQDAVYQALRYCETASRFTYEKLNAMFKRYHNGKRDDTSLQTEHKNCFGLSDAVPESSFNKEQRLLIIGNASSEQLVSNVDFWKSKGLSIDLIPYRIYKISGNSYFEFFSPPYDLHANPKYRKGVIFDTCRTHIDDSIWYMCENARVAAFGSQKHIVCTLNTNDLVFLYHKGEGIVAGGRIRGPVKFDDGRDAHYREVEWQTMIPNQAAKTRVAFSVAEIKHVLGHDLFWAKTMKVPYLSAEESDRLMASVRTKIGTP